jgi:hypothetical protein
MADDKPKLADADLLAAIDIVREAEAPEEPEPEPDPRGVAVAPGVVLREGTPTGRTTVGPSGRVYKVEDIEKARMLFGRESRRQLEPQGQEEVWTAGDGVPPAVRAPDVVGGGGSKLGGTLETLAKVAAITGQSMDSVTNAASKLIRSGSSMMKAQDELQKYINRKDAWPAAPPPMRAYLLGPLRIADAPRFSESIPTETSLCIWRVLRDRGVNPGEWQLDVKVDNELTPRDGRVVIWAILERYALVAEGLDGVEPGVCVCAEVEFAQPDLGTEELIKLTGSILGQRLLVALTEAGVDLPDMTEGGP